MLVRAAKRGDEGAWEALVHRFTPAVRSVARDYRLPPHDVDDVVQACWLALLEGLHRVREPDAVGAWLVTAARRRALRARRCRERDVPVGSVLQEDAAAGACVENAVAEAERVQALREALGRLPGRQRRLLEALIARPDLSHAEIAGRLGMPQGSVGPTRSRGLERLRMDTRLVRAVAA